MRRRAAATAVTGILTLSLLVPTSAAASPLKPGPHIERVTFRGSVHVSSRPVLKLRVGVNRRNAVKYLFAIWTGKVEIPCADGSSDSMRLRRRAFPLPLNPGGAFWGISIGAGRQIDFGGRVRPRKASGRISFSANGDCETGELRWKASP